MADTDTVKFCVGNVNPGEVNAFFMHGMMDLVQNPVLGNVEFQGYYTKSPSGPYLDVARNFVVQKFLDDTEADVLLFIDSDIEFSREAVEGVVHHSHYTGCVSGGWYSNLFPGIGVRPVAFSWDEDKLIPIDTPDVDLSFPVDTVGTGFMAIPRQILLDMVPIFGYPSPWFAEEVMHGSAMGEDVTFCQRVIHGLERTVWFNPLIRVNHIKPIKLTPFTQIKEQTPNG